MSKHLTLTTTVVTRAKRFYELSTEDVEKIVASAIGVTGKTVSFQWEESQGMTKGLLVFVEEETADRKEVIDLTRVIK